MKRSSGCLMRFIRQSGSGICFRHCLRGDAILHTVSGCDPFFAERKKGIRLSDISDAMNLPRPGVTRTVKEMEAKGYLQKLTSPDDGRVTYISITEKGERLSRKYDQDYFSSLAPYLSEISEEEADNMIRTIGKFYQIMCDRREHYDK